MKTLKLFCVISVLFAMGAAVTAQTKSWVVPANSKSLKNPVVQSEAGTKTGLALFTRNCVSCHGKTGQGNGVKVAALKNFPGDFSRPEFQSLADGEIFFRIKTGKDEMPKFEGKLLDDEIWNVVNYLRTFKR
jgi:mono/diheme cytochrome c family protein